MKERESNIELLRLVCMFMIVMGHFICHHGLLLQTGMSQTEAAPVWTSCINALFLCAVNAFILISGYFSIRPKAKSFFNLYLVCAFYAGVLYVFHLYATGSHLNRWVVYNTLMPFGLWKSSTDWWFVPNYLILYILSPILNKIIDNISKREFQYFLILQAIVVFYFGWYRNEAWNQGGFNFINFIFLYFIGRYLALHYQNSRFCANGGGALLWLLFGLLIGCVQWYAYLHEPNIPTWMWFNGQYNNPLCIAAAMGLFMCFKSLHVGYSKVINWFAASVLSIYLVTDCAYVRDLLYSIAETIYGTHSWGIVYGLMMLMSLGLVICVPIIDKVRMIITNPIRDGLSKGYERIKEKSMTLSV